MRRFSLKQKRLNRKAHNRKPLTRKILHLTLAVMLLTLSLPRAVFSQASTSLTNEFIPLEQIVFVQCANNGVGEEVLITGILHIQTQETFNQNRFITRVRFQPQGASGVGLITGDVYRGTGVTQSIDSTSLSNGSVASTFINNFRIIGRGPDNNFQVHENIHVTFNAASELVVFQDNVRIDCN